METATVCYTAVMSHQDVEEAPRQRRSSIIVTLPLASEDFPETILNRNTSSSAIPSINANGISVANNTSSSAMTSTTTSSGLTNPSRRTLEQEDSQSRGLPLINGSCPPQKPHAQEGKLFPSFLRKLPLHIRFGVNGLLSNLLFMLMYNEAVEYFDKYYSASTIYSIVYLIFIPLSHAMGSLFVFGWPERYFTSLMSNFPIGITAIAIGSAFTAYLDQIDFNNRVENYIRDNFTFSHMPSRSSHDPPGKEFYSSIVVLIATSIWTYALSVYINISITKSDKKKQ